MFNIAKKVIKVKRQLVKQLDRKKQKGFTLIEVLIVVAIIVLLFVAFRRSTGRSLERAKDSNRKSDLKKIKIAFENYYNNNNCYPPEDILENCGGNELMPYLAEIPCDPLGFPYLYLPIPDTFGNPCCGGYRVLARIQIANDPDLEAIGCPGGCGVPTGTPYSEEYNYGVAEGIALNQNPKPVMTIDPTLCTDTDPCYCCPGPGNQCNVFSYGAGYCQVGGPYRTVTDCYNSTDCAPLY